MNAFLIGLGVGVIAVLPIAWGLLRHFGFGARFAGYMALATVLVLAFSVWAGWHFAGAEERAQGDSLRAHRDNPERTSTGLAESFEAELAARGEDVSVDELVLLARTQEAARKYEKAAATYALANRRTDFGNADMLVAEAQARLNAPHADGGASLARERLDQALALAPEHPGANYYLASLKLQAGDTQGALPHLELVLDSGILQPDAQSLLRDRIAEWRGEAASTQFVEAEVATAMEIVVEADAAIEAVGGTLFVFLRLPEGPPMPLAAKRVGAPSFPLTLTISDADRLQEGRSLASYDRLMVGARLSTSGEATGNPGDPQAQGEIRPATGEALRLKLEQ
jgi:cytochrome c-type biogenesis protein CcmH